MHVKVTRMFVWVCGSVLSCWRAKALGFRVCVGVHVKLSAVVGFRVCVYRDPSHSGNMARTSGFGF